MERKNLIATYVYDVLKLADVVVVDVQCDYLKEDLGNVQTGHADVIALEKSIEIIADRIGPDTLVLIETTVAPGTTEQVAYPIIKKRFEKHRITEGGDGDSCPHRQGSLGAKRSDRQPPA